MALIEGAAALLNQRRNELLLPGEDAPPSQPKGDLTANAEAATAAAGAPSADDNSGPPAFVGLGSKPLPPHPGPPPSPPRSQDGKPNPAVRDDKDRMHAAYV